MHLMHTGPGQHMFCIHDNNPVFSSEHPIKQACFSWLSELPALLFLLLSHLLSSYKGNWEKERDGSNHHRRPCYHHYLPPALAKSVESKIFNYSLALS